MWASANTNNRADGNRNNRVVPVRASSPATSGGNSRKGKYIYDDTAADTLVSEPDVEKGHYDSASAQSATNMEMHGLKHGAVVVDRTYSVRSD